MPNRRAFLKYLCAHGCELLREGSNHSWYANQKTGARSSVPRHNEIKPTTARAICKQLGVPPF